MDRLLAAFDHPLRSLLFTGRPRRFTRLPAGLQDAALRGWGSSRLPAWRAAFEGLRRVVLSTAYSLPDAAVSVGHRGPLHRRAPQFSWEGPAAGTTSDTEPIARVSDPAAPVPSPRHRPMPLGVIQGADLAAETVLRADVCVIGSGAGGAVIAARLAEAGRDVIVLEEGGFWHGEDFTEDESQMVPRLYADAGMRTTADFAITLLQGRCVGGGTTVNWMIMLRPPDHVMDEWQHEHGVELLGPGMLVPALERIEEEVHARRVPDDAHAPPNRVILDGAARLGWRAEAAPINARNCVRAGTCGLGCRWGAKQGMLETFLPRALAAGARLYSDVRVTRLDHGGGARNAARRVHGVVLDRRSRSPRGRLTVDATILVLAAGGVGTPMILQRSGLGGGGVGRFLRLHPTTAVFGVFPHEMYAAAGIPQSAVCTEFRDTNDGYGFWIECPPLLPGVGAAALPGFGDEHRRLLDDFTRYAPLIVLVRDGHERARSQGEVVATRRGGARIRYRLGDAERRTLAAGIHAAARMQRAAGAEAVVTLHDAVRKITAGDDIDWILRASLAPNRITLFSAHVNGTCRMGTDPRTSGCSPEGQRHGVPGIYVADGSVLPSAPGANPQAVIMATASSIADRVLERHRIG